MFRIHLFQLHFTFAYDRVIASSRSDFHFFSKQKFTPEVQNVLVVNRNVIGREWERIHRGTGDGNENIVSAYLYSDPIFQRRLRRRRLHAGKMAEVVP